MPKHYDLAQDEIGTVEWAVGSNPKVVAYFEDAGHSLVRNDETAWCAAFVGAMLFRAGLTPSGSLLARSYSSWGERVADLSMAQHGDLVVLRRGEPWQGHVGFYAGQGAGKVLVLGGNQSDAVSIEGYRAADIIAIRRASAMPGIWDRLIDAILGVWGHK
jgi:uncharacterized protein (TIGR02594 family)